MVFASLVGGGIFLAAVGAIYGTAYGIYKLIEHFVNDDDPVPGFNGCVYGDFSANETFPTLGLVTADVAWAATDHMILARIYYGQNDRNGQWSEWRNINNEGCDDRERGQMDFYDDFKNITERWLAVALYNCGTDGLALDGIFYWNGTHYLENVIDKFCANVAGPYSTRYGGEYDPAETGSYCFESNLESKYYDYVWLDQDNGKQAGIVIQTGKTLKGNSTEPVAKFYAKSDPGIPDCGDSTIRNSFTFPEFLGNPDPVSNPNPETYPNAINPLETITITATTASLFNEMGVLIAFVALLVCLNVVVITMWMRNKRRKGGKGRGKYAKVDFDESESSV